MIQLFAALLPPLLLLLYIYKKDPQPEPTGWLLKALLYGVGIGLPTVFVETVIAELLFSGEPTTLPATTLQAFVGAALPEEGLKLVALWLVLRRNPYFDEHFDGIVYAVFVSLGFAALENVFYVMGEEDWLGTALVRAFLAVPGHYAFGVLMGYYYSLYHFVDRSPRIAACVLLVPVAAHGIYDTIAFIGTNNPYLELATAFLLIWFCIKMHKYARKKVMAQISRDRQ